MRASTGSWRRAAAKQSHSSPTHCLVLRKRRRLDDLTATPTTTSANTSWVDALPVSKRPVNESLTYSLDTPILMIAAHTNEGRWKIRTLGNLHIYREDGSVLEWFANKGALLKAKTLFSYLLLRGEQGATAEHLADLLWRDVY
jgi:hypothetical protein